MSLQISEQRCRGLTKSPSFFVWNSTQDQNTPVYARLCPKGSQLKFVQEKNPYLVTDKDWSFR